MSLYRELKAAGCEVDSHYSDLYVKSTSEAWRILKANVSSHARVSTFKNNIDGQVWIDVPFAFEPYWDRQARKG